MVNTDEGTGMKAPREEEGGIIAQGVNDVNWIFGRPASEVLPVCLSGRRLSHKQIFLMRGPFLHSPTFPKEGSHETHVCRTGSQTSPQPPLCAYQIQQCSRDLCQVEDSGLYAEFRL